VNYRYKKGGDTKKMYMLSKYCDVSPSYSPFLDDWNKMCVLACYATITITVKDAAGKITTITLHCDEPIDKVCDSLTEIWNQIVGAVAAAVKAVVEALNAIKSGINDVLNVYAQLLSTLEEWIESGAELTEEILEVIADVMEVVVKGAIVAMGVFLTATAALTAIKVATVGIGAFVSSLLYQTVLKDLLFKMILSIALMETFNELSCLFEEGEEPDDGMSKIISFLGITGTAVEKLYSIGDAFVNRLTGKIGVVGYYIGIFLAFTGMLVSAAAATLSGSALIWAERVAIGVSVVGLGYSLWLLVKDKSLKAKKEASPLITMIELAIGICGVVSAVAKYINDTS